MSWGTKKAEEPQTMEMDAELKQALGDFKASVHAWSDAEFAKPRTVHAATTHRAMRLALGWSLAGVLLAAGTTGVLYVGHERQQANNQASNTHPSSPAHASEAAPVQPRVSPQEVPAAHTVAAAPQEEELLASVDSAISRTVPSAMDPLVDLSEESGTSK